MNRLLGRYTEGQESKSSELIPPNVDSGQQENDIDLSSEIQNSPYNLRQRPQSSPSPATTAPKKAHTPVSSTPETNSSPHTQPSVSARLSTRPHTEHNVSSERRAAPGASGVIHDGPSRKTVQGPPKASKMDAHTLEIMRISACCFVAFLARFIVKSGFGHLLVQSIFLPFVALEVGLFYIMHTYLPHVSVPQVKGSLISTALVLCGIKPELIDTYINIMSHATMVTNDFCLYIFAFIISNAIIA